MQWSSLHRLGLLLLLCALLPAARSEEPLPWSQLLACQGVHRQYPFCDTSLPLEDRVKDVIARLELSEKLEMLTARRSPLGAVRRLGIPEFNYGTNCVHAVKSRCTSTKCPTLFPAPPNLAATFNDSIWELVGEVMAVELRVLWRLGVGENNENNLPHMGLTCWGPTINMAKDPRWGRNMEAPGEDPYLAGVYGAKMTRGMQGVGQKYLRAVTTLKHFEAYGLESWNGYERSGFDATVEPYDLASTYFPVWKHAIRRSDPKGVMCSYNAVNGVPMCANKPFIDLLRNGWGFDGYVTSDTGAVRAIFEDYRYAPNERLAAVAAIGSGVDVDSSSWGRHNDATPSEYVMFLPAAVEKGELDEQVVDDALFHALKIRFQLGLFDPPHLQPYLRVDEEQLASPFAKQLNIEATLQSIVLLQNPSNILPLRPGVRLAVIGPHANATAIVMIGNYRPQICPGDWENDDCMEGVFDQLARQNDGAGGVSTMTLGSGVTSTITNGIDDAVAAAKQADAVIFMVGLDHSLEKEGIDREYISLPPPQIDLVDAVLAATEGTNTQHVMVVLNGGAVSLDSYKDNDRLAIVDAFCPSFYGARAIADIVFGRAAPSGKLPVTVYPSNLVDSVGLNEMALAAGPGRTHRYFRDKPLWPFGFGLSYTEFELRWHAAPFIRKRTHDGDDKLSANPICEMDPVEPDIDENFTLQIEQLADAGQEIVLPVQVSNIGDWDSAEVVQVYVVPIAVELANPAPVPLRQLATFKRVALKVGDKHCLRLVVEADAFHLGDALGNVVVAPGQYQIVVSNDGITDVALVQPVWLKGKEHLVEAFPL